MTGEENLKFELKRMEEKKFYFFLFVYQLFSSSK